MLRRAEAIAGLIRQLEAPLEVRLMAAETPSAAGHPGIEQHDAARHSRLPCAPARNTSRPATSFSLCRRQRFETPFAGDPIDLFRALRHVNPSPYMFCLLYPEGYALVGSSPEIHVRCLHRKVEIRPIAGTRPRGSTPAQDAALAAELLADPKECAEHIMLVDLARNDVGRVADFGSIEVTDLMIIERYSHVMHIVSHVAGTLHAGKIRI